MNGAGKTVTDQPNPDILGKFSIHHGDLPETAVALARRVGLVSWDLETSGLDWRSQRIALCQIHIPGVDGYIVRMNGESVSNLKAVLEDESICKIFHHAIFDLRFMMHHWHADPVSIVCTKISSKICYPERDDHSLQDLLARELRIKIDKSLRTSDWLAEALTKDQVVYAASDVYYLSDLFEKLKARLAYSNRWKLADASFKYLPVRAALDILGSNDVFQY